MKQLDLIIYALPLTYFVVATISSAHISAKYLMDTINDLKTKRKNQLVRNDAKDVSTPTMVPTMQTPVNEIIKDDFMPNMSYEDLDKNDNIADKQDSKIPPLQLTKAELALLYQNALQKGNTIKFDPGYGGTTQLTAAVHELAPGAPAHVSKGASSSKDGFYYYYYPLKSFINEVSSAIGHGSAYSEVVNGPKSSNLVKPSSYYGYPSPNIEQPTHPIINKESPLIYQTTHPVVNKESPLIYHHQHNVQFEHVIPQPTSFVESYKKKGFLEPLYMALSGFIGMTVMFILSTLVLPKFQKFKTNRFLADDQFDRFILQAIERDDCNEHIACKKDQLARNAIFNNRLQNW